MIIHKTFFLFLEEAQFFDTNRIIYILKYYLYSIFSVSFVGTQQFGVEV